MSTRVETPGAVIDALRRYWGFDALRPLQGRAIEAALAGRDSLLVMPTGGGKSLCFQLPALLRTGITVVVSPLIALMKDQVDGLHLAGFPAAALNSTTDPGEAAAIRARVAAGSCKLLYVSPERVLAPGFLAFLAGIHDRGGLDAFAIDEAHCISQWGHDFRPEYRRLAELRGVFPGVAFHAFTATATPRVREDIVHQLRMTDADVMVGDFDRPNLTYRVVERTDPTRQVIEVLARHKDRATLVYCISRADTEMLADGLTRAGHVAKAYHAGLDPRARTRVQQEFIDERLNIVCATVAFGMGIDRSDVRCVIHAAMPKSLEHYQQETGRAGRDGLASECVLLAGAGDAVRWNKIFERGAGESDADPEEVARGLRVQRDLLAHVQRYCAASECRHAALAAYFGQPYSPPSDSGCGACDLCLDGLREIPDSTTIAQKILSCVYRVNQSFGAAHVIDVLRGSRAAKVIDRGHDRLSTHGLLSTMSREQLHRCVQQLIALGHLARSDDGFSTLSLTPAARDVLAGRVPVRFLEPAGAARAVAARAPAALDDDARSLFESLRALRRRIAQERNVPPYVIFSDATLEAMARARPSTASALLGVRGVGEVKLRELGDAFVSEIVRFCTDRGLAMDAPLPADSATIATKARSPRRPRHDAIAMFEAGASIDEVARALDLSPSTIAEHLCAWIVQTRPASVHAWVDDATYERVAAAYQRVGGDRLRPVWEHLEGQVPYETIRVVLAHAAGAR